MNKHIQNIVLDLLLAVILPSFAWSQHVGIDSNAYQAEKIYLQTDGMVYTTNQTIWFKAIVANAGDHTISKLSGVLYVELIDPNEKILEKKLVKLENGAGTGFFDLNQDYQEGLYQLRSYTEWDKNFNSDFFFKEYIQVFDPSAKARQDPINNITLIEKQNNIRQLQAYLDPSSIDSLNKNEITVYLTLDNKRDSVLIKKNNENKYVLNYSLTHECQFVTLKMQTESHSSYTRTIVMDENRIDLQFFPESGELVNGIESNIGFKALDYNGKGTFVEGEILNIRNEVVALFKSNQLGMGSFVLINPGKDEVYSARLKSKSDTTLSLIYPLPQVVPLGNVLSVKRNGDKIHISAASSYLKNDTIYMRISCRGLTYYEIKGNLKEGLLALTLPSEELPDGIIAFTLMDKADHPVAERLYYNYRPEDRLYISISSDSTFYSQRQLTRLNIETANNSGAPVKARLSLLVINKDQLGKIQDMRQNILSWFLLSSDIKGEIEDPGFYFRNNNHFDDLDALLLTQGWRKYLYARHLDTLHFRPESRLNVSGNVGGVLFRKKRKEVELTMMTFGNHKSVQTLTTDTLGQFHFDLNDEYGQNLNILIQSANRAGIMKDYTIRLDKKVSPPVSFNHLISIGKVDSVVHNIVEKNIERKIVDEKFKVSSGDHLLPNVEVEAYRMTPARQKVMTEYGKPEKIISGEAIQEKEEKWSYGLYSVLMSKFPDKIRVFRIDDGELLVEVRRSVPTMVAVDGVGVNMTDFDILASIPPGEVSSFEIIKSVNNVSKLWFEFCPFCDPLSVPKELDLVAIYTYGGRGLFGASKTTGLIKANVPVFSSPREFYAPKYEKINKDDWYKPDLRQLIHWEPDFKTDSSGKASVAYYNGDIAGDMEVVVEGITEDGKIGYKEFVYSLKKRNLAK